MGDLPPISLPANYRLGLGSPLDRATLLKFMQRTYAELQPNNSFEHLATTVDQYFSQVTPLWWIEHVPPQDSAIAPMPHAEPQPGCKIGCVWLGSAIDQLTGDRHSHVFLLYVDPAHRRRGLGTALMQQAENWATARGDRQIGLQVFQANQAAIQLYRQRGYQPQAVWMSKRLKPDPNSLSNEPLRQ